ncbi:MAG TPA: serine hydrolase domain-containing protein [Rubrobacteraceae bacterium]|nr:serine hydrolase domain-containing protein [Rubrobacteraceae bacterium]
MSVEALETFIQEKIKTNNVPGLSVSVMKGARVIWERGFGLADLATSTPATPQTSYLWFSMTKIVTATAVMRLAESGNLDLDAPADEYFRGFKVVSQPTPVTVRHLLSHTSGLANPLPIRWVRPADSLASDHSTFVSRLLAKNRNLKYVPGERARYSNLGYLVLGEVISEVTGLSYEDYVRREILSPLRMDRTGFSYPEPAGAGPAIGYHPLWKPLTPLFRAALPRGVVGSRQGRYVSFNPFYVMGPAYGGLVGSVEEAARFVLLHLNSGQTDGRRLLSAESVAMMQWITPRGGKRDFGLGWFRSHEAKERRPAFVEHLGGGAGFWNVMRIYPEKSLGVVMMGNTTRYDHESICDTIVRVAWV